MVLTILIRSIVDLAYLNLKSQSSKRKEKLTSVGLGLNLSQNECEQEEDTKICRTQTYQNSSNAQVNADYQKKKERKK